MPERGKALNIDEWCEQFLDIHHDLMQRKKRGEKLTKMEAALLLDLTEQLEWIQAKTLD